MSRRRGFQPGDVLGFASCEATSVLIALGTWGIPGWSVTHVGIVSESPDDGRLVLFESMAEYRAPCAIAGHRVAGIQAHQIRPRVLTYPGRVWHYPLAIPLGDDQAYRLASFCLNNLGRSYDFLGAWRARQAGFGWLARRLYSSEDLSALFCSEFVAAALRDCDEWEVENASEWSPKRLCRRLVRDGVVRRPVRLK